MLKSVHKWENGNQKTFFLAKNSESTHGQIFGAPIFFFISCFKFRKSILLGYSITLSSVVFILLDKEWVTIFFLSKYFLNIKGIWQATHTVAERVENLKNCSKEETAFFLQEHNSGTPKKWNLAKSNGGFLRKWP